MPKGLVLLHPATNPSFVVSASAALTNLDTALPAATCLTCFSLYPEVDPKIDDYLWFRKKEYEISEVMKRFRHRVKDPLFNLLAYDKFEELKEMPLFMGLSEFDPVLDQAIDFAKKWQGETTVDIARRLQHGYVAFTGVGSAVQDCQLVIQRFKQILNLDTESGEQIHDKEKAEKGKEKKKRRFKGPDNSFAWHGGSYSGYGDAGYYGGGDGGCGGGDGGCG